MMPTRVHKPWLHWMVVATFWLAALVPALGLARAALAGELPTLGALCSTSAASGEGSAMPDSPAAQQAGMAADCPFCWLQAQSLALPPAPPRLPLASERFFPLPESFLSAPRTAHAWRCAPARAPPASTV